MRLLLLLDLGIVVSIIGYQARKFMLGLRPRPQQLPPPETHEQYIDRLERELGMGEYASGTGTRVTELDAIYSPDVQYAPTAAPAITRAVSKGREFFIYTCPKCFRGFNGNEVHLAYRASQGHDCISVHKEG